MRNNLQLRLSSLFSHISHQDKITSTQQRSESLLSTSLNVLVPDVSFHHHRHKLITHILSTIQQIEI
jgi:hypothetical protein